MRSSVARILVLSCSLILVLPQGWCCIFAFHSKQGAPETRPCCDSCCCNGPAKPSAPAPKPSPEAPTKCPCSDRNSTAPNTLKVLISDLSFVASFFALDLSNCWCVARDSVAFLSPVVTSCPQLLNCVWLC